VIVNKRIYNAPLIQFINKKAEEIFAIKFQ